MSLVLKIFDYTFYRIYRFLFLRGDDIAESKAWMTLSLLQVFLLLDVLTLLNFAFDFGMLPKLIVAPIVVAFGIMNWSRYGRNFDHEKIKERWKHETPGKALIHGWLIGLFCIVSILILVLHGSIKGIPK